MKLRRRRRQGPVCEIHTAISPTAGFATRVLYLAASLRQNGGQLADCPLIVTVGGEPELDMEREHPWSRRLGVEWRWLNRDTFERWSFFGTAARRFTYDVRSPTALLVDADTIFTRPIDDALALVSRERAVAGVIAHLSPFAGENERDGWNRLFSAAGLGEPPMVCEHTGWQILDSSPGGRHCPPYYNLGFVLAPSDVMAAIGSTIFREMGVVDDVHPTVFRCQLGLTLALLRAHVNWTALPLRFNLPNYCAFLPRYQSELDDVRMIHYLSDEEMIRNENFISPQSVGEWLAQPHVHPINERLAEALADIHGQVLRATDLAHAK